MEQELVRLLTETTNTGSKAAEAQLKAQYTNLDFPLALTSIACHDQIAADVRQAALLALKTFVLECWSANFEGSANFEEFAGQFHRDEAKKADVRQRLLDLSMNASGERKVKNAASLVVCKIANADFPDDWPDLLPTLFNVVASGADDQIHGALKVLNELVDDCFNEDQFFTVARDLVKAVHGVAVNENRRPILRALAVSVFCSCFDTLELVLQDHKAEVKAFADEALGGWMSLFVDTLKNPLPPAPADNTSTDNLDVELYRGRVALKLQVVKILMRVRSLFPQILSPQSPALFSATWQELSNLQRSYHDMYIQDDRQGRLEDADGLPYTLDFLVLEELDFMQACLRAPPVKAELQQQLRNQGQNWVVEVMKIAVAYAQITTEEEGLWDIDINVFLSEETNVTANYTPRTACGELVIKLGEWLSQATTEGLLTTTSTLYAENASWKAKEASLYLLNQLLSGLHDIDKEISPEAATGFVDFIKHAMQEEAVFLRARGYLVAGSLTRTSGDTLQSIAVSLMQASLGAIHHDESEIVKVSCIRALAYYLACMPTSVKLHSQGAIINALSSFLSSQDLDEPDETDDLLITIIETLRDAILMDTSTCLSGGGLDLLFTIASKGASNFQIAMLVTETFEEIASTISETGPEPYAQLAAKVLPSLMGAFDIASLTDENALANLSAELLSVMAANGTRPLPQGFAVTVMPRLNRLLLGSSDDELLKSATTAITHMIDHDPEQVINFQDQAGKGGLEVVLIIIDRLLNPSIDDNGASEVGGLAAAIVEKAGSERLGPYLPQLLHAVAARLATAEQAQFIQSLIMVFARLSLISAQEVVGFLAEARLGDRSALEVVVSKWLENSVNFAGYEDIRQNVVALCKLYELNDPRLAQVQVKGDLVVPTSNRIMTRSRAKQNPDQYTIISAQLKIVKVLVQELLSAAGGNENLDPSNAGNVDGADDDDEDGEWEDDENEFVDLASGMTKSQLMAYAADDSAAFARGRDDDTQAYLLQFFRGQAGKAEFGEVFGMLTTEEQEKLRSMSEA